MPAKSGLPHWRSMPGSSPSWPADPRPKIMSASASPSSGPRSAPWKKKSSATSIPSGHSKASGPRWKAIWHRCVSGRPSWPPGAPPCSRSSRRPTSGSRSRPRLAEKRIVGIPPRRDRRRPRPAPGGRIPPAGSAGSIHAARIRGAGGPACRPPPGAGRSRAGPGRPGSRGRGAAGRP